MNSPYSFIGMIALFAAVAMAMFNVDRIDRAQKIDEARIIAAADSFLALEQRLDQQGIDSARWPAQNLGAAGTEVPTIVALFSTSLASQISSSASSMTLVSAADKAGVTLASSTYPFIIDEGTASEELVIADCTGTACANMIRGIDPVTGTSSVSSLKKSHRRGASVKITDGPQLMILSRMANGIGQYPNLLQYKNTVLISAASASTTLATKYYVDNVALSGAPDASETVKGVVELGTALEVASSSSSGGTSASLIMQSKNATDTPQSGCASGYGSTAGAGCSIIASLTGKIKQAWIDLTAAFTWTGLHTFSAGLIGTASSTYSATTSIMASNVNSNAFILNGVSYAFPSTQGTASQFLQNNGSGTLSWANSGTKIAFATSTITYSSPPQNANQSLASTTISGSTIGNGMIHSRTLINNFENNTANVVQFRCQYGGTTFASASFTNNGVATTYAGTFDCYLMSSGGTSAQVGFAVLQLSPNANTPGATAYTQVGNGTAAIDSTASQTFNVSWNDAGVGGAGETVTAYMTLWDKTQ